MKNLQLLAVIAAVGGSVSLNAGWVDVTVQANVNTVVTSCASQRGAVNCSSQLEAKGKLEKGKPEGAMGAVLGSIGEYEKVAIPVTNVKSLGTVNANVSGMIADVKVGTPDVISFKPTTGTLAGKEIYVAFKKVARKAGTTMRFDKVDIYARQADKSADQWFNAGEIFGNKDGVAPQAFTIGTNGTLTTAEPNASDIVLSDLL